MWNVAPGAPIHVPSPMGSPNIYPGYPSHGHEMQHGQHGQGQGGVDYFSVPPPPPSRVAEGYFPPVANLVRSSGLVNEIKQDSESPESRDEGQGGARSTSDGSVATSVITASASEISSLSDLGSGVHAQGHHAADLKEPFKLGGVDDAMARLILSDEIRPKPLMNEISPTHPPSHRTQSESTRLHSAHPTVLPEPVSTSEPNLLTKTGMLPTLFVPRAPQTDVIVGVTPSERRASWTPELTRKDFRKGLIGGMGREEV